MIIDCHGHYTTAPKALEDWRNRQIAGIKDPSRDAAARPTCGSATTSCARAIETNQLRADAASAAST